MFCVGTSHLGALQDAAQKLGEKLDAIHVKRGIAKQTEHSVEFTSEFAARLAREQMVFSVIGGNSHNVLGMRRHRVPFDFIHADYLDVPLDQSARPLPFEVVKDTLLRRTRGWLDVLGAVAKHAGTRLRHFESPPQIEDQVYMTEGAREAMAERGILKYEISPPAFRFKLWRLHSQIVKEFCAQHRIEYIPIPVESTNERGFLKQEYWGNPTHANAAYGALVLQQMKRLAR